MKLVKKVLVYVLVTVLAVTCIPPIGASAATDITAGTEKTEDDGLLIREYSDFAGMSCKKRTLAIDSSVLTHNEKFNDYIIENGIDISHHNGVVDWEKVKADGVDFVILRMAYRGYGSSGNIKPDNYAYENLDGARAAGLDIGVYFFSQAITVAEAKEEADYILNMIKDYDMDLPVVMDFEYTAGEAGRLYAAKLTKRQKTNICLAFCEKVEEAGYDAMVYANKSMLTSGVYADEIDAKYEIWLAEWTKKASYDNDYTYWQYTSDGSVDGVPSERVDLNVRYIFAPFEITGVTDTTVTMEWRVVDGAEGYLVYRKAADEADYQIIAQIDDTAMTTYTDTGLTSNRTYSYYVRYYKIDENGEQVIYKSGYPVKTAMTPLQLQQVNVSGEALDAGTVKLAWEKDPNATGYVVQQYNYKTGKYQKIDTVLAEEADTSEDVVTEDAAAGETVTEEESVAEPEMVEYVKPELIAGTTYKFRVRALADIGGATVYGTFSTPVEVTTASKLIKPVLTAKPQNYTTNKLSWTAVPGATAYQIQKYNYSKKKWILLKTVKGTSTTNTYLNCNTSYRYRVRAIAKLDGKTINSYYSVAQNSKTKGSRIGVVKNGPLNIRTGPGTGYKKLITVKKGRNLTVTGSTAKWYRVKIKVKGKFKVGYVSKQYVKLKATK